MFPFYRPLIQRLSGPEGRALPGAVTDSYFLLILPAPQVWLPWINAVGENIVQRSVPGDSFPYYSICRTYI